MNLEFFTDFKNTDKITMEANLHYFDYYHGFTLTNEGNVEFYSYNCQWSLGYARGKWKINVDSDIAYITFYDLILYHPYKHTEKFANLSSFSTTVKKEYLLTSFDCRPEDYPYRVFDKKFIFTKDPLDIFKDNFKEYSKDYYTDEYKDCEGYEDFNNGQTNDELTIMFMGFVESEKKFYCDSDVEKFNTYREVEDLGINKKDIIGIDGHTHDGPFGATGWGPANEESINSNNIKGVFYVPKNNIVTDDNDIISKNLKGIYHTVHKSISNIKKFIFTLFK